MRIGYRRFNGTIGVTEAETGARGLWLEKRNALVALLRARGHEVQLLNPPTRASAGLWDWEFSPPYDMLLIEFSAHNFLFNGKGYAETFEMLQAHQPGRVVFICDDPDLQFPWTVATKDIKLLLEHKPDLWHTQVAEKEYTFLSYFSGWSCWFNTAMPDAQLREQSYFSRLPDVVPIYDMPFASLLRLQPSSKRYGSTFAYIGRPDGRKAQIEIVTNSGVPWSVYGKQKEWDKYHVVVKDPPTQSERAEFYAGELAAIGLADRKHIRTAWRTGRLYHSVAAGSPAIVWSEHRLPGFATFATAEHLRMHYEALCQSREVRESYLEISQEQITDDLRIVESTLQAHDL